MLLLRLVLSVVQLGLVVAVSVWWSNLQDDCFDSSEELTRLGWTTFGLAWVSLGLTLGFLLAVHRPVSTLTPVEFWASVLQKQMCLCCWRHCDPVLREEEPDLFDKIAEPFAQVFDVDGVVMGDVATGMFLVKAAQIEAAKRGEKRFYVTAPGMAEDDERMDDPGPEDGVETAVENIRSRGTDGVGEHRINVSDARDEDAAALAAGGVQPRLSNYDWRRIAEARYFCRYAVGAYGWPLHGLMDPFEFASCQLCSPCLSVPDGVPHLGAACCNASLRAFLNRSGVEREDLVYVNLQNHVGRVVFIVAADRPSKTLVIACRGTLSLEDAITDLDAGVASLEPHGLPGHVAHRGFVRVATGIKRELIEERVISSFLSAHGPEWNVKVVGHSLGAGITSLLTILLKQEYPNVSGIAYAPPPSMDLALATNPEVCKYLSNVVYNKDIVCRLGVHSVLKLKMEMQRAYRHIAVERYSDIRRLRAERRYSEALHDPVRDGDAPAGDTEEYRAFGMPTSPSDKDLPAGDDGKAPLMLPDPLYVPGRIYHMVRHLPPPDQRPCCNWRRFPCCCLYCVGQGPECSVTVYPADHQMCTEIMVDESMFCDHMPNFYMYRLEALEYPAAAALPWE